MTPNGSARWRGEAFLIGVTSTTNHLNVGCLNTPSRQVTFHYFLVIPSDTQVVGDLLHRLPPVSVGHKHTPVAGVFVLPFTATDMPRVSDHQLKIVIVINAGADTSIVMLKFFKRDLK
jgi:hypothetical protein